MLSKYKEILVLDTNIILNDVNNLHQLSNGGENLLVISETVLNELDNFKSGWNEINYQSREFGRLFDKADVISINRNNDSTEIFTRIEEVHIDILVVSKSVYRVPESTSRSIINDRKIIEIAEDLSKEYKNVVFMSIDNMARFSALSLGLEVRKLVIEEPKELVLYKEIEIDSTEIKDIYTREELGLSDDIQGLSIRSKNGNFKVFYFTGGVFKQIDEDSIMKQNISPKNIGQKILSSQILDPYFDCVVVSSPAGVGKTISALSNAMRLLDIHKDRYEKIIYIRKTSLSDTEELGHLPGTLEEKMSGYLAPLYSNLEFIVEQKFKNRKKRLDKEEKEKELQKLVDRYQIEFLYEGHLRGTNIRKAIVIIDEVQNESISSLRTAVSRIGEDCKLVLLGSNRQIDSKYVNKYNNALTYICNKIPTEKDIHLTGISLEKVVRSKMAEWGDNFK